MKWKTELSSSDPLRIEFWGNWAERSNHCSKAREFSPYGGLALRPNF